jgi:hypothetical protein
VETMVAGVWLTRKSLLTINSVLENLETGSSCGDYGCWCLVDSEVTPDNKFRIGKSRNGFVVWRLWLLVFGL